MLPNFLVGGAVKAAATWLYLCIEEHPEIFVPALKEIHFFSTQYDKGFFWYKSFFQNYSGEKAIGEVSPSYLRHPVAAERIASWRPTSGPEYPNLSEEKKRELADFYKEDITALSHLLKRDLSL